MKDASLVLDEYDIPLCPFCGNALLGWEPKAVVLAHGCAALVHEVCLDDAIPEPEENEK